MSKMLLLSAAASLLILTGCSQTYVITTHTGERIQALNKPRLVDGWYIYKDANGRQAAQKAIGVREIAPTSMASKETFTPVSSK